MERLATIWVQNVQGVIESGNLPWQVSQIGCRGEYSFRAEAPRNGQEANAAEDFELQQYLQLHAMNRGVLMTPFHNMALMSPKTTDADLERHLAHFQEATESLLS
jgi:glutamate-1-semialdehyde aminotransferase